MEGGIIEVYTERKIIGQRKILKRETKRKKEIKINRKEIIKWIKEE